MPIQKVEILIRVNEEVVGKIYREYVDTIKPSNLRIQNVVRKRYLFEEQQIELFKVMMNKIF